MIFKDDTHKNKYKELLEQLTPYQAQKPEAQATLYLIALIGHEDQLFDFGNYCIKPDGIFAAWQTSNTVRITRLAFNLWNGNFFEEKESNNNITKIFGYSKYDKYFLEALRIRYQETV